MFLFQKRFAIAINLLRRQFYIWRLSEPLELLLFPISTSPTLTLLYFYFCFHFVSVSLNLLIFSVNSWVSLSNFFDFTGWLWHLITTWINLTKKKAGVSSNTYFAKTSSVLYLNIPFEMVKISIFVYFQNLIFRRTVYT